MSGVRAGSSAPSVRHAARVIAIGVHMLIGLHKRVRPALHPLPIAHRDQKVRSGLIGRIARAGMPLLQGLPRETRQQEIHQRETNLPGPCQHGQHALILTDQTGMTEGQNETVDGQKSGMTDVLAVRMAQETVAETGQETITADLNSQRSHA